MTFFKNLSINGIHYPLEILGLEIPYFEDYVKTRKCIHFRETEGREK